VKTINRVFSSLICVF